MKNGIILSQCKSTWTSRLDLEYLDETSAVKQEQAKKRGNQIGKKLQQFADYASKELVGQVHAAGYFHDLVAENPDGSFASPVRLSNEERKKRLTREWAKVLRQPVSGQGGRKDVIQHRMVFSMSKELHDACLKSGVSPERVLHKSMKTMMRKFQEKFHPADRIGYAYGFHHDTDHLHVHVALCPRTESGQYVGVSTPKYKINRSGHKDQLGFLRKCCEAENKKWGVVLSDPEKIQQMQTKHHAEKYFFAPKISQEQRGQIVAGGNDQALRLQGLYDDLSRLHRQITELKIQQEEARYASFAARFFGWKTTRKTLKVSQEANRTTLRQLRARYFSLRRLYLTEHSRFQKTYGPTYNTGERRSHAHSIAQRPDHGREQSRSQAPSIRIRP
jgi:hypothetical protein